MGKKNKKEKISLNGSPLQAITIGQIKENKYGWIGTVVLFVLFVGIVYFLPDLFELYQKYTTEMPRSATSLNNTVGNQTKDPDKDEDEIKKYGFLEKNGFEFAKISVADVMYFNGNFSYNISNKTSENLDLSSLNLYIELYDESGNLLKTYMLNDSLTSKEKKSFTISVPTNILEKVSLYTIREIKEEDFTYIDLVIDENKQSSLSCTLNARTINYSFIDEKLKKVQDNYTYAKANTDYDQNYAYYNNIVNSNYGKQGINATISSNENEFVYQMTIDYLLNSSKVDDIHYFEVDSSPRVVNFKMEALGFDCR